MKFLILVLILSSLSLEVLAKQKYSNEVCQWQNDGTKKCWKPKRPKLVKASEQVAEKIKEGNEKYGANSIGNTGELAGGSVNLCDEIVTAYNKTSGDEIKLFRCQIYNPQRDVVSRNPLDGLFYLDKEHKQRVPGSLVTFENGKYYVNTKVPKVALDGLPGKFNCDPSNMLSANQCLVCNCFHEIRNASYAEMFLINRVVHSRVLTKDFVKLDWKKRATFPRERPFDTGNEVCDVVYDGMSSKKWGAQFSWTRNSEKKAMTIGSESNLTEMDMGAYNKCTSAAKKSLDYRDEFFATHYLKKNLERKWENKCLKFSKKPLAYDPKTKIELEHDFYKACDIEERKYLTRQGSQSPRPLQRPSKRLD